MCTQIWSVTSAALGRLASTSSWDTIRISVTLWNALRKFPSMTRAYVSLIDLNLHADSLHRGAGQIMPLCSSSTLPCRSMVSSSSSLAHWCHERCLLMACTRAAVASSRRILVRKRRLCRSRPICQSRNLSASSLPCVRLPVDRLSM